MQSGSTSALIVGDVHLSERPPSSRTAEYRPQILDKLKFCVDQANELSVPLVQAGDLFHLKAPSKNSHALVQEVHSVLKEANNGVWIVPGNHDLSGDRLDSIASQPLGSLCRMSNIRLLLGYDPDLPGIMGIPYLSEFDGGEWENALGRFEDKYVDTEPSGLLVTHAPLFPPGQAPGVYASIDPEHWADYWGPWNVKSTYYGHIHDCHGTYVVEGHTFCNQGALSRGSLHEATVNRKPAVTLWNGSEFTRIEVPHLPPEKVFKFDEALAKQTNKASAAEFAAALGQVSIQGLTVEQIHAKLATSVADHKVLRIISECLEEAL